VRPRKIEECQPGQAQKAVQIAIGDPGRAKVDSRNAACLIAFDRTAFMGNPGSHFLFGRFRRGGNRRYQ